MSFVDKKRIVQLRKIVVLVVAQAEACATRSRNSVFFVDLPDFL